MGRNRRYTEEARLPLLLLHRHVSLTFPQPLLQVRNCQSAVVQKKGTVFSDHSIGVFTSSPLLRPGPSGSTAHAGPGDNTRALAENDDLSPTWGRELNQGVRGNQRERR